MPARILPNLGLTGFFDLGSSGWDDEMSANLLALSVLAQATAVGFVSATPPTPADKDVYVFKADHPTHANAVAVFEAAAWTYYPPAEGWQVFDRTNHQMMRFNGAAWAVVAAGGGGGGGGGSGSVAQFIASYTVASGVEGGAANGGTWNERPINTVQHNSIVGASLAANEITMPAGSYRIDAHAGVHRVDRNALRLRDTTAGTTLLAGISIYTSNGAFASNTNHMSGYFTLAVESVLRLQMWTESGIGGNGLGIPVNSGNPETYTTVTISAVS